MTTRALSPAAHLVALLSRFPTGTVALAKRALTKVRRALAGTNQIVYDYGSSVVVSFSMSERGYEAIVSVAVRPGEVRLYFDRTLPDPKGLLGGSGGKVRYVTVKTAAELGRGDILALIKAAKKHSKATFRRTASTKVIIKSKSKER